MLNMNKAILTIFISVGGIIGGYLPTIFGANGFSGWSLLGGTAGSLLGIWIAFKVSNYVDG